MCAKSIPGPFLGIPAHLTYQTARDEKNNILSRAARGEALSKLETKRIEYLGRLLSEYTE